MNHVIANPLSSALHSAPTYSHGPFQELLGYEIVNDERGLFLIMPIRRAHLSGHGVLHGGVSLALLDAIGGRSVIDRPLAGNGPLIQSSVTVTISVDFLRAVDQGVLYASATPDHIGKTLAYVGLKLTLGSLDGEVISRGIGTYRVYAKSLVKAV